MEYFGFLDRLLFLCRLLENQKIDYMLLGGVAVSVWASPRATVDIDLLIAVDEENIGLFKDKIQSEEIVVFENSLMRFKKVKIFRFFLKPHGDDDLLMVDAILADDAFKKTALLRCETVELKGTLIRVAGPEDLILFKLLSARGQDYVDIENIVELHGEDLDRQYLISWGEKLKVQDDLAKFI